MRNDRFIEVPEVILKKILIVIQISIVSGFLLFSQSINNSTHNFWDYWTDYYKAADFSAKEAALLGAISSWRSSDGESNLSLSYDNLEFLYWLEGNKYYELYNSDRSNLSFQSAADNYGKSIELRGTYAASYENLYKLYEQAGNLQGAISVFNDIILKYPNTALAYRYRGDSFLNSSLYTEAFDDYTNASDLLSIELSGLEAAQVETKLLVLSQLTDVRGKIANIFLATREYKRALALAEAAIQADIETQNWHVLFTKFKAASLLSMLYFGSGEYDKALFFLNMAQEASGRNEFIRSNYKFNEGWNFHADIINQRKNLGTIAPLIRHKMMLIYYQTIEVSARNEFSERINNEITEDMKEDMRLHYRALNRYIETFSQGRMTLEFSEIQINEPIRTIQNQYADFTPVNRAMPWEFWDTIIREYDSVILCWNGHQISNTFFGGGFLSPYDFDDSRGVMQVPVNWLVNEWNVGLLMHEFFHIVEFACEISPTHGAFSQFRSAFPGWTGTGEFDYFLWHFRCTLSTSLLQRLDFRARYPVDKNYDHLFLP